MKKIIFAALWAAAALWASGLPEVYKPREKPAEKPKERVEKAPEVGAGKLYDARVVFTVGGVAPEQVPTALVALVPVLERRAAGLANRSSVAKGPAVNQVTVELKGCPDPARAVEILAAPGRLAFDALAERKDFLKSVAAAGWSEDKFLPLEDANDLLLRAGDRRAFNEALAPALPEGYKTLWTRPRPSAEGDVVRAALAVGDGMFVQHDIRAVVAQEQFGAPRVDFELGTADAVNFAGLTGRHVGDALAVVFDDEMLYSARVQTQAESWVTIFGDLDRERAAEIALVLNSGSLPAVLTPAEFYVDGVKKAVPAPKR